MLDIKILEQIISCKKGALEAINIKELSSVTNIQTIYKEIETKLETELTLEIKENIRLYVIDKISELELAMDNYLETDTKVKLNTFIETDSKPKINAHIDTMIENIDTAEAFIKIEEKMNLYVETDSKPRVNTHVETVAKPSIDTYTTEQEVRLQGLIDSHAVQGNLVFQTIAERDAYVLENANFPEKVFIGLTTFVIDTMRNYFYKGTNSWGEFHSPSTVHIGLTEPEDKTKVWVNPEEEDVDQMISGAILEEFRTTIQGINEKVNALDYSINKNINPGVFDPPLTDEDGNEIPFPKTVEKIKVKRGAKKYLVDAELTDGEMAFLKDSKELIICSDGKLINLSNSGGGGNLSGDHLDLIAPNKTKYRITINNTGNFVIYRAELDEAPDPKPEDSGTFKGIIINQIYGGGGTSDPVISHDFIELYNNTKNSKNLKGLTLQYGTNGSPWQVLELKGEILPYSSFLIRCGSNKISDKMLHKINDYDIDWNVNLSDKGMKVLLTIGRAICTVDNPFNADGAGNKYKGYIDLIGVAGIDKTRVIDAFEGTMKHIMNKNISARRHDFKDKDNHHTDIKAIDFTDLNNKIYLPRCSQDGSWDSSFDKEKLDTEKPSLVSMTFGKNAETTRCFTWQSTYSTSGTIHYCKKSLAMTKTGSNFISVDSTIRQIQHKDCDASVHSAIIRNLESTTYVYRVSFVNEKGESKFTPLKEFTVKAYTNSDNIKFIHTTDQQSWDEHEYDCWKLANQIIDNRHPINTYDFRINTGDISQNANRSFEWRYYFKHTADVLSSQVEMTTLGNNDLIDKLYSEAWTYYYTYEDSPLPSVYSYDIGYCHFVSLDAWIGLPHHFQEVPSPTPENPDNTISVDKHLEAQLEWLDKDLSATTKRWKIVYMHLAPYTISVNAKQRQFVEMFEKHGVQLVICGHNHCYSRTLPLKGFDPETIFHGKKGVPIVNEAEGIYYVLCQATGYKLSGKDKPKPETPWIPSNEDTNGGLAPKNPCWTPDQPSYIVWDISYDSIKMKSYMLKGLINKDPQFLGTPQQYNPIDTVEDFLYDTFTITHK